MTALPDYVVERCARAAYEDAVGPERAGALPWHDLDDEARAAWQNDARAVLSAAHTDLEREVIEACVAEREAWDVWVPPQDRGVARDRARLATDARIGAVAALLAAREAEWKR